MSLSVTLNRSMARGLDAVSSITQYAVMIAGLSLLLAIVTFTFRGTEVFGWKNPLLASGTPQADTAPQPETPQASAVASASSLKPQFAGVLEYVKRRYRVSPEAVLPVLEVAEMIGRERRIDPLLILAIIGVESGFNPFAESAMGARGLMQVIPRFHMDKVPEGVGLHQFFEPAVNIRVGVHVLEEAIQRRGGVTAGLQYYAGSSDTEGGYATKVLAEKARMEKAARRLAESSV